MIKFFKDHLYQHMKSQNSDSVLGPSSCRTPRWEHRRSVLAPWHCVFCFCSRWKEPGLNSKAVPFPSKAFFTWRSYTRLAALVLFPTDQEETHLQETQASLSPWALDHPGQSANYLQSPWFNSAHSNALQTYVCLFDLASFRKTMEKTPLELTAERDHKGK